MDVKDWDGWEPLHAAAFWGQVMLGNGTCPLSFGLAVGSQDPLKVLTIASLWERKRPRELPKTFDKLCSKTTITNLPS